MRTRTENEQHLATVKLGLYASLDGLPVPAGSHRWMGDVHEGLIIRQVISGGGGLGVDGVASILVRGTFNAAEDADRLYEVVRSCTKAMK